MKRKGAAARIMLGRSAPLCAVLGFAQYHTILTLSRMHVSKERKQKELLPIKHHLRRRIRSPQGSSGNIFCCVLIMHSCASPSAFSLGSFKHAYINIFSWTSHWCHEWFYCAQANKIFRSNSIAWVRATVQQAEHARHLALEIFSCYVNMLQLCWFPCNKLVVALGYKYHAWSSWLTSQSYFRHNPNSIKIIKGCTQVSTRKIALTCGPGA